MRAISGGELRTEQVCQNVRCGKSKRVDWLNRIDGTLSSLSLGLIAESIYDPRRASMEGVCTLSIHLVTPHLVSGQVPM